MLKSIQSINTSPPNKDLQYPSQATNPINIHFTQTPKSLPTSYFITPEFAVGSYRSASVEAEQRKLWQTLSALNKQTSIKPEDNNSNYCENNNFSENDEEKELSGEDSDVDFFGFS